MNLGITSNFNSQKYQTNFGSIRNIKISKNINALQPETIDSIYKGLLSPDIHLIGNEDAIDDIIIKAEAVIINQLIRYSGKTSVKINRIKAMIKTTFFGKVKVKYKKQISSSAEGEPKTEKEFIELVEQAIKNVDNAIETKQNLKNLKYLAKLN